MRICLVNPFIPPAPMNFQFAMPLVGRAFSHIPLPLITIAALTPAGIEVELVDENVEAVDLDLVADVVAFTGIYCQRARLFELADAFRARGRKVAIGGAIVSDLPEACAEHADVLFFGEAEETWPRFCAALVSGAAATVYRAEGWADMSASPVPRYDLLKADRYSSGCVQATRGCPYRCEYCDVPDKQGRRPRSKSVGQVLEEVRRQVALGFDSIFFVDDHFAGNRRYAIELLTALAGLLGELSAPLYFYTQVTLNVARDEELLALFHAAGFRRFFMGIETPDPRKLRDLDKTHNVEIDMRAAIAKIQSYNITIWAGIILGLDGDDESSFDEQYRFIMDTGITPTLVGLLQAMPGAPLHERIVKEGRLRVLPTLVGSNAEGSLAAQATTNITPMKLTIPALLGGFSSFVRRVYAPRAYTDRLLLGHGLGRQAPASLRRALSWSNAAIVARTVRFYLLDGDPELRSMLLRVLGTAALRRGRNLEELLFHLAIYKHLRTFYFLAADEADRTAGLGAASRAAT